MAFRRPMAFTLIEVLVVVVITAVLLAVLLPAISAARLRSKVVAVHAELRQLTVALDAYAMQYRDHLPPARQSCGTNILYQLPVELAKGRFLPQSPDLLERAFMEDRFVPGQTYRYRAPGAVWQNGVLMDFPQSTWRPRAKLWVPDDAPGCASEQGRYYANRADETPSPVSYAVWSMGPDRDHGRLPRFDDGTINEDRLPLPRDYWLSGRAPRSGLITHFRMRNGLVHTSP